MTSAHDLTTTILFKFNTSICFSSLFQFTAIIIPAKYPDAVARPDFLVSTLVYLTSTKDNPW